MAHHLQSINDAYTTEHWHDSVENSTSSYIRKKKAKRLPDLLPYWMLKLNAKLSGVKTKPNDKIIIGLFIYLWLLFSSISFVVARFWYMVVDIQNPATTSTFFNKSFEVVITLIWCSMGIYAHRLTAYIFSSPSLLKHVRIHTRSFLKINSAFLNFVLVGLFCACNIRRFYVNPSMSELRNCSINNLPEWMCDGWVGMGIVYSVPAVYFNMVVYMVLLSVMRTHTIVLRRQVSELEQDGKVIVKVMKMKQKKNNVSNGGTRSIGFQLPLIEIESLSDIDADNVEIENDNKANQNELEFEEESEYEMSTPQVDYSENSNSHEFPPSFRSTMNSGAAFISVSHKMIYLEKNKADVSDFEALIISNEQLIYRYRFLFQRALIVSLFFQRWMLGWLFFVVIWTVSFVIEWIHSEPNDWQIILLILPIIIFWILASAYAEVNNEATRFMKAIYPITERMVILRYLSQSPIQVGIFTVGLTYTTMISIVVAMGVAIISKIVIDEMRP